MNLIFDSQYDYFAVPIYLILFMDNIEIRIWLLITLESNGI